MSKTRTLVLAAGCTAAGALGAGAVGSVAHNGAHHRALGPRAHHVLARAVHAEAVVPVRGGSFATITLDRGVVKSVAGNQLTITEGTRKATYKDVAITVPGDARIHRRGTPGATLGDLRTGDRVLVVDAPRRFVVLAAPARR